MSNNMQEASLTIPDICLYGFIAHTFGVGAACQYFSNLLKSDSILWTCPPFLLDGQPNTFVIFRDVSPYLSQHQASNLGPEGYPMLVLDYAVDWTNGPVVPQILCSPSTGTRFRQHVALAQLQMPIYFTQETGSLGFTLVNGRPAGLSTLRGLSETVNLGGQLTKHFRIVVSVPSIVARCVSAHMPS